VSEELPTDAERFVEEIVDSVREAIFVRAIKYARIESKDRLTPDDIEKAASRLFLSNVWTPEVVDRFI